MMRNLYTFLLILASLPLFAQNISGKVVDSKTGETIPFANIMMNNSENLISNSEGFFAVPDKYDGATPMVISYMGYSSVATTVDQFKSRGIVSLTPGMYELQSVDVKTPDVNTIMSEVRKNLPKNYKTAQVSKNMLFVRESNQFKPETFDFEIKKSTGFSKKSLESVNKQLDDKFKVLKKYPPRTYTDMLCNYYTGVAAADKVAPSKVDMIKATKLWDEDNSASLEEMESLASGIMLKHLDTLKYYRIKSGIFGSRDTISLRKDYQSKSKKKKEKSTQISRVKNNLTNFYTDTNFALSKNLTFVRDADVYEYKYEGATISNNELVYIVSFEPRKSRGIFTGKLYISEADYGIVRADYALAKGKKVSGVNLKLLLGIKFREDVAKGTLIYRKKASADDYYLQYASVESGQYFYFNRPIKFIELAEEDKDVVAMDLKIEGNMREKTEFLNISHEDASAVDFQQLPETDFKYQNIKKYDPALWKGYSVVEPLEEMKQFSVAQ